MFSEPATLHCTNRLPISDLACPNGIPYELLEESKYALLRPISDLERWKDNSGSLKAPQSRSRELSTSDTQIKPRQTARINNSKECPTVN